MPDLYIKERLPGGGFKEMKPAFGEGKTQSQTIEDLEKENATLKAKVDSLDQAMLELVFKVTTGS